MAASCDDLRRREVFWADFDQVCQIGVSLENENFPEVSIALYRYDGERCLAVVDGESVSLAERSAVIDLVAAACAIVLRRDDS